LLASFAFNSNLHCYTKIVVAELKSGSQQIAAQFKEASVLFIEISDFAALSATLPANELVALLNFVFTTFDDVLEAFGSTAGAYTRPLHSSTQAGLVREPFCVQFVASDDPSI
jgi:class 3 adenylate cyclase